MTAVPAPLAADRQALVDLGAITGNVAALRELVRGSQVMAVVKADGYGHGMVPAARAALAGGAAWLGTADLAEAVALRQAGITAPVACLMAFGDPGEAVRHGIDVTAGSVAFVAMVEAAAVRVGVRARLHLEADSGLSRGGATPADWPAVVEAALAAQSRGSVQVTGLWSHFACADIPGHPSIAAQLAVFADAVDLAEKAGVAPEVRHIANTAAALTLPESRLDLVRFGGACYGLSTLPGGAAWLGTADLAEAVALRQAGITAPVACLMAFGDPGEAIRHGVDITAGSVAFVAVAEAAAVRAGVRARLHLEADTGLSRGGATPADWPALVEAALAAQARGSVQVTGLWSHFACADIPGHPSIAAQLAVFADAVDLAEKAGVAPEVRHIANTAAALTLPESRLDLVRFGGACYGLSTLPGGAPSWLRPAMTLRARLALVKRVPAGTGVSYGHRYVVTARETTLGVVPLGYADGVPRAAAGLPLVSARGRRWPIAGTVCMDQFVVDFGDEPAAAGDEVVLFGPGDDGEPTAQEWGEALGTISYDLATGIGARVPRTHTGG